MQVSANGIDETKCLKASFVVKAKGSNMAEEIRKMIDQLAKEYDEKEGK